MPQSPVDDVRLAHAALQRFQARLHFGNHALVDHAARYQVFAAAGVEAAHERLIVRAVEQNTGRVGQEHELLGLQLTGDGGGGGVGVYVQPTAGLIQRQRWNHRHHAGRAEILDQRRVDLGNTADSSKIYFFSAGSVQKKLFAGEVVNRAVVGADRPAA